MPLRTVISSEVTVDQIRRSVDIPTLTVRSLFPVSCLKSRISVPASILRERGVRAVGIARVGSEGVLEEIVHAVSVRIGLGGSGGWGTPTILAR
jgi:hypothetical protein